MCTLRLATAKHDRRLESLFDSLLYMECRPRGYLLNEPVRSGKIILDIAKPHLGQGETLI